MGEVRGRVWMFGDDVDTDVMFPGAALRLPTSEACTQVFAAIRPTWHREVRPGDLVVGGRSFGSGSARPVARLFRALGVAAVLAESMSTLFQRNCINAGLLALSAPGITQLCQEGDVLSMATDQGSITNISTGATLAVDALPPLLGDLVDAGGVIEMLRRDGYLPPTSHQA